MQGCKLCHNRCNINVNVSLFFGDTDVVMAWDSPERSYSSQPQLQWHRMILHTAAQCGDEI